MRKQNSWPGGPATLAVLTGVVLVVAGLAARGAVYEVGVFDHFFEPFELSIQTGDTVVWTAYGFGHTIISDTRLFDSSTVWGGSIPALFSFKFTFHEPGIYPYYSVDYGGPEGTGMSAVITVTGTPTNQFPLAPTNSYPAANVTNQPIRAELRASAFGDADPGDVHFASQWIVRRVSDNQITYDSGEVVENGLTSNSKTNRFLPELALDYGTAYRWQVRYRDSYGGWSPYSAPTAFSTLPPFLRVMRQNNEIVLTWPTNAAGFGLESATNLASAVWVSVGAAPQAVGGQLCVTNSIGDGPQVYRLRKP